MLRRPYLSAFVVAVAFLVSPRLASAEEKPVVVPLLSTGMTTVGEPLHYPAGPPHVTAAIVTFPPGAKTALHRHGVPMFAYILEGEVTVDYGDRGKRTYHQGDALIEAMDVPHFGADIGSQPVRILVVNMGAEGVAEMIPVK